MSVQRIFLLAFIVVLSVIAILLPELQSIATVEGRVRFFVSTVGLLMLACFAISTLCLVYLKRNN